METIWMPVVARFGCAIHLVRLYHQCACVKISGGNSENSALPSVRGMAMIAAVHVEDPRPV